MRRRTVHLAFGVAAVVCASLATYGVVRLLEAQRVNDEIAAAGRVTGPVAATEAPKRTTAFAPASEAPKRASGPLAAVEVPAARSEPSAANPAASTGGEGLAASTAPEAQFAHAVALAQKGDYEGALKQYKLLSRGNRPELATDALYNAGNLQLREALKEGRNAAVKMLPLIELAKQSYRSALRRDPQRWDARYNLERALWLAPELDEQLSISVQQDAENRVMSTLQSTRADLP